MKLRNIAVMTLAGALMTNAARAVHIWEDPGQWSATAFTYSTTVPKYTGNELSIDLSGTYLAPERRFTKVFETDIRGPLEPRANGTEARGGRWGGNVGANYFFTPWLGIGGDATFSDHRGFGGPACDYVLGNLILRAPICNTGIAPYIFGGGGREFNGLFHLSEAEGGPGLGAGAHYAWIADLGVGIEYRITPGLGIFGDGRYIWHLKDGGVDRLALRAGLRIAF